jgi:hypothetical protein
MISWLRESDWRGWRTAAAILKRVIVRSFSRRMGILEGTEDEKEEKLKREFLS